MYAFNGSSLWGRTAHRLPLKSSSGDKLTNFTQIMKFDTPVKYLYLQKKSTLLDKSEPCRTVNSLQCGCWQHRCVWGCEDLLKAACNFFGFTQGWSKHCKLYHRYFNWQILVLRELSLYLLFLPWVLHISPLLYRIYSWLPKQIFRQTFY